MKKVKVFFLIIAISLIMASMSSIVSADCPDHPHTYQRMLCTGMLVFKTQHESCPEGHSNCTAYREHYSTEARCTDASCIYRGETSPHAHSTYHSIGKIVLFCHYMWDY